jgi:preprotein translocase subunit SecA
MIKKLMTAVFGSRFERELKQLQPIVDQIKVHEERLKDLSEPELRAQTQRFRERIAARTGTL